MYAFYVCECECMCNVCVKMHYVLYALMCVNVCECVHVCVCVCMFLSRRSNAR